MNALVYTSIKIVNFEYISGVHIWILSLESSFNHIFIQVQKIEYESYIDTHIITPFPPHTPPPKKTSHIHIF